MSDIDNKPDTTDSVAATAADAATASNAGSAPATQDGSDPAAPSKDGPADAPDKGKFQESPDYKRISRQRANAERRAMRAEEELKALRAQLEQRPSPQPQRAAELRPQDFASYDEYMREFTRQEARKTTQEVISETQREFSQREQERQARAAREAFEREVAKEAKAAGIDFQEAWETLTSDDVHVSKAVAEYLFEAADHRAALIAHLADNTDELARISELPQAKAHKELAKLDAQLGAKPKPNVTKAPPPVPTVGGRSIAAPAPDKMGMEEYADYWRERRQRRA